MDILVSRTLYMSCQAGLGIEPGPSAQKASALPIELTWQTEATCRWLSNYLRGRQSVTSCRGVKSKARIVGYATTDRTSQTVLLCG